MGHRLLPGDHLKVVGARFRCLQRLLERGGRGGALVERIAKAEHEVVQAIVETFQRLEAVLKGRRDERRDRGPG